MYRNTLDSFGSTALSWIGCFSFSLFSEIFTIQLEESQTPIIHHKSIVLSFKTKANLYNLPTTRFVFQVNFCNYILLADSQHLGVSNVWKSKFMHENDAAKIRRIYSKSWRCIQNESLCWYGSYKHLTFVMLNFGPNQCFSPNGLAKMRKLSTLVDEWRISSFSRETLCIWKIQEFMHSSQILLMKNQFLWSIMPYSVTERPLLQCFQQSQVKQKNQISMVDRH